MQPKVDRLVSALQIVKDLLNMRPTDPKFLVAVLTMASNGVSLWEKKIQVFKSFGFSQQEAFSLFKRYSECFGLSEVKLGTKLSFYFNNVKLKTNDIITYPVLLGLVLKLILSMKLLKEDARIAVIFKTSEDEFLSKYVIEHLQHVPSLLKMYNNDRAVKKIGFEPVHMENMDLKAD